MSRKRPSSMRSSATASSSASLASQPSSASAHHHRRILGAALGAFEAAAGLQLLGELGLQPGLPVRRGRQRVGVALERGEQRGEERRSQVARLPGLGVGGVAAGVGHVPVVLGAEEVEALVEGKVERRVGPHVEPLGRELVVQRRRLVEGDPQSAHALQLVHVEERRPLRRQAVERHLADDRRFTRAGLVVPQPRAVLELRGEQDLAGAVAGLHVRPHPLGALVHRHVERGEDVLDAARLRLAGLPGVEVGRLASGVIGARCQRRAHDGRQREGTSRIL
ncbi:hypothetical protein [Nannocystis punicea]|uniref:Uncharacterized protein n=1 Tax=Nannocystis punicea TaxID=2995304 RepID=A0ABY7H049_9BACT|nr:hypothetical protein [Nannocystis poenicansa]WAS92621.1 hypothetical protein O0S08_41105 [Nannocystis poenicansa]